jgi:hypothetical protein
MSFALKWEPDEIQAGGFLFFDAVISHNQSYKGSITKHPISTGSSISDHYISENPTFTLSAVIADTDISTLPFILADENGTTTQNTYAAPTGVSVESTDLSVLTKFIPNVIGQFLPDKLPEVKVDDARGNIIEYIRGMLISLLSGTSVNQTTGATQPNIREVSLYETDKGTLVKRLPNSPLTSLVVTSLTFREDVNTGTALYFDMSFEQVTFVELKKTTLPKDVRTKLKPKAASKKIIGKCDGTVRNPDDPANKDTTGNKATVKDSTSASQPNFGLGGNLI